VERFQDKEEMFHENLRDDFTACQNFVEGKGIGVLEWVCRVLIVTN
jgi:hypothetical protein